jgi:peptidoglycan/LPS O-acetylase OafA/YrhL
MWLIIILIIVLGALTGTLGSILEIAAGIAVGLFLFAVGLGLAVFYYVRRRLRQAAREWERRRGAYPVRGGPSGQHSPPRAGPDRELPG